MRPLVHVRRLNAGSLQRVDLQVQILFVGTDPCVADFHIHRSLNVA